MKVSVRHTELLPEPGSWTSPGLSPAPRRAETAQQFEFVTVTGDHERSDVQAAWRRLLEARRSPEQLYQLPEFFRYLMDTAKAGTPACDLYLVRRSSDGQIVGIVPGRRSTQTVGVRLGPLSLFQRKVLLYQVLGSVPLLDDSEGHLSGFVFRNLLQRHPDCRALLMQAMPEELAGTIGGKGLSCHILNGWQNCHTMPLPENVEDYLQKLSAKKRYNLSRQVRLLAKEAGEVSLVRVEDAGQVAALTDGMRALLSAEDLATQPSQMKLESLARHGLLHSYVLQCGGQPVALVLGTRTNEVWYVHKICCKQEYMSFSVGTSMIHLALQDAIAHFDFDHADFGYGTPNQEFRATHVLQRRGKLLLCRRHSMANLLFRLHGIQDRMNEVLISRIKTIRKQLRRRRQTVR
ncbi:GNAT family N-acetyltransferase [Massilia sp. LXY-6]|uniref:GNAT family N-acetyltransferase n=1 Tax=Massilia sp. LXY-6 TaxID=3379823 RepID=UPI003EE1139C